MSIGREKFLSMQMAVDEDKDIVVRDCNPGFGKPGARGNPLILPNPKPGFMTL